MESAASEVTIDYRRSRRAKYLRIRIEPTQAVIVTVPIRLPLEQAQAFVETKRGWIHKHLEKMRHCRHVRPVPTLSPQALKAAQQQMFDRLEQFSKMYRLPFNRVSFRCQRTRWGSCSPQNNISLNINLAFLPAHLQDYVLLHELCHVRHKNHGRGFWMQLDSFCNGQAKALTKELKSFPMYMTAS